MSWEITAFQADHVAQMQLQPRQARVLSIMTLPYIATLAQVGPAATALMQGRVVACAGVVCQDYGVGTLWAFIAHDAGQHFVRLHRCARRLMHLAQMRRIEASAEVDFGPGCRWLELLGFQSEGLMKQYGPDGSDHIRFAWLSHSR